MSRERKPRCHRCHRRSGKDPRAKRGEWLRGFDPDSREGKDYWLCPECQSGEELTASLVRETILTEDWELRTDITPEVLNAGIDLWQQTDEEDFLRWAVRWQEKHPELAGLVNDDEEGTHEHHEPERHQA